MGVVNTCGVSSFLLKNVSPIYLSLETFKICLVEILPFLIFANFEAYCGIGHDKECI